MYSSHLIEKLKITQNLSHMDKFLSDLEITE